MRNINVEHEGILKPILDGNADTAVRWLVQHDEATADIIPQDEPYGITDRTRCAHG
jgi:hypothetical protein